MRRVGVGRHGPVTLLLNLALLFQICTGFINYPPLPGRHGALHVLSSTPRNIENGQNSPQRRVQQAREELKREKIVKASLLITDDLKNLELVGKASLPTEPGAPEIACAVLAETPAATTDDDNAAATAVPCLFVPLERDFQMSLLECAVRSEPLDLTRLYVYNMMFVGRDGALYDNVPWATWTIDPDMRNRDAANNAIDPKFHMGKRDAYNRFMGKDLLGKSQVLQRLQTQEQQQSKAQKQQESSSLTRRILQVQILELEMDVAQLESELAIRREQPDEIARLSQQKDERVSELEHLRERLSKLGSSTDTAVVAANWWKSLLPPDTRPKAPYPGATGYPAANANDEKVSKDQLYRSPFDLLLDIIKKQLNAEVIGTVLENTSLLDGTTSLGGVIVLRRIVSQKTMTIAGEKLSVDDEDEEFGNQGLKGGEVVVVECDADEAIAVSLATGIPLQVEQPIWDRSSILAQCKSNAMPKSKKLALWESCDPELSILVEGQAGNQSATERTAPLRIPRTSTSLFDSFLKPRPESASSAMFPTDNPVASLDQFDALSNEGKARTLMQMSNFDGRLPRPRAVRESERKGNQNVLDNLLLPLIDESARRQYQIREAENNGDSALAEELRNTKSRRQVAKELAERARLGDDEETAEAWESEAEFLETLRADVTQDEGSYSRFLDRDDWYERDRQKTAKRVNKKSFGSLLDGIE